MVKDLLSLLKIESSGVKGNSSRFVLEPLPTGFGHTLGNALRRVLLSSLSGAAVTQFKIEGVDHQFSTLAGMREDVVEFSLNVKKIRIKIFDENPVTLKLSATGPKEVKAGDLEILGNAEVINKDLYLFTLADRQSRINLEMVAEKGTGYVPSEERKISKIGVIPVDSIFSPIVAAAYKVEDARLGRKINLDRLILEVATDGTILPEDALKQASRLLVDYFKVVAGEKVQGGAKREAAGSKKGAKKLSEEEKKTPVEDLGLSTRTANALARGGVKTLGGLAAAKKDKLEKIRGLGERGLAEIEKLLGKRG